MKLQALAAIQGVRWVRMGVSTFFRQPLALTGLFFLFLAGASVLSIIPVPALGNLLALVLLPGITLGLMAAAKEASEGKFPMPWILISAFRGSPAQRTAMFQLGGMYTLGILIVMGITVLIDGGKVAQLYLMGGTLNNETVLEPDFQVAVLAGMALYLPLSLVFWHAPALVYWHGVTPVKSLFFSAMACLRNFWAYTVFGLAWMGLFIAVGMVVALIAGMTGNVELVSALMLPIALLMASMFFNSIYFSFSDSFEPNTQEPL